MLRLGRFLFLRGRSFFGLFGFVQTWNLFAALTVGIPVGIVASYLCAREKVS